MSHTSKSPLKFASLFSGCGGFDLGFVQQGSESIGALDIDPWAIATHKKYFGSAASLCDLSKGINNSCSLKELDVLIAGPPCQGFSTIGKRDLDDPRNELLLTAGKIALEFRPRVVVIENVAGVMSGEHQRYWKSLEGMLRAVGYKTEDLLCEAAKMGVPQMRKRRIILAWLTPKLFCVQLGKGRNFTLREALANITGSSHQVQMLPQGTEAELIARRIGPGQKLSNVRGGERSIHTWDIPEVFGTTTAKEKATLKAIQQIRRKRRVRKTGDADPVPKDVLEEELKFDVSEKRFEK